MPLDRGDAKLDKRVYHAKLCFTALRLFVTLLGSRLRQKGLTTKNVTRMVKTALFVS